jgi:hypothetical protein
MCDRSVSQIKSLVLATFFMCLRAAIRELSEAQLDAAKMIHNSATRDVAHRVDQFREFMMRRPSVIQECEEGPGDIGNGFVIVCRDARGRNGRGSSRRSRRCRQRSH